MKLLPSPTALALCALTFTAAADNWPQWRGPYFNGSSTEKGLPSKFSKEENVKWIAPMPGPAAATPIIWQDRVFMSSTDKAQSKLVAICLDRKTGKVRWQQVVADGFGQDPKSNYASQSPVTDGQRVFFFYGTGDLAAFDLDGKKLWARNIQKEYGSFAFGWTFSASPILYEGRLILQVLQRDVPVDGRGRADGPNDSYLLALDPNNGKELWKQMRPSEAKAESREAFTTPVPYRHAGRDELLVAGGDCLTGHDPATGRELWRWGTWNPERHGHWRLVPSPAAGAGIVLACAPKDQPVYALRAGGNGVLTDSALAWTSTDRDVSSDVPTPLFYRDRFFILNGRRRVLSCVEPATGKVLWKGELPGARSVFEASPTGADNKIYMMNHAGDVIVAEAGNEFKILHHTNMADEGDRELRATIVAAQGTLFVRTGMKLYCIGVN